MENQKETRSYLAPAAGIVGLLVITLILAVVVRSSRSSEELPKLSTVAQQSTLPVSAPVASAAAPVAVPQPSAKKHHKRPPIATYTNSNYGVSFDYPSKYSMVSGARVEQGESTVPVPLNFVQPGGVVLTSVEIPQGFFPDTDFLAAFLNVSVNKNMTEEECSQFAMPKDDQGASDAPIAKAKVGDHEFEQTEMSGDLETAKADARYYHLFESGACYEFALGLGTTSDESQEDVRPVNKDKVFGRLEQILATVKIKSDVPEVAAGTPVTSTTTAQSSQPATTGADAINH
jgi:hypothetical protein